MDQRDVAFSTVILGAGPCGLGAAWRLKNTASGEMQNYLLIDESETPGGRAASCVTPEGFIFDQGGHVLYPHKEFPAFVDLLDELVDEWHESKPVRGVWMGENLIPYPIQKNIHRLPAGKFLHCVWGLGKAKMPAFSGATVAADDLLVYLKSKFGSELTRLVLGPLNHKMWAYPPEELSSEWTSHRSGSNCRNVPDVAIWKLLRNLVLQRDELGWDESTRVRYPLRGGTGAIWTKLAEDLPAHSCSFGTRVTSIDPGKKLLRDNHGRSIRYERLISTIPVDILLHLLEDEPQLSTNAERFRCASVQLFGFGIEGYVPDHLRGVHSFHVPEKKYPFWRVNFPSHFSPGNVPDAATTWSVLCEVSSPSHTSTPIDAAEIESSLRQLQILHSGHKIVSRWSQFLGHGYPVPFRGRDAVLNTVHTRLHELDILSRGRFGGWKYEVSNQDHAFMQGVEAVDFLMHDAPEATYFGRESARQMVYPPMLAMPAISSSSPPNSGCSFSRSL
ncbi:protoporphyrinogen/coproporphyrinogen oxidase [Silvibacterium acidisoli]|uniref:protoporphyrinogen/coproporphyrinogen oxidase n=1 Tax=Acidobacteriaceae bacterium ZG23-2 TaxID=2883246 RepID=UPI00406C12BE